MNEESLQLLHLNNDVLYQILAKAAAHEGERGAKWELLLVCKWFRDALLSNATSATVSVERPALLRHCSKLVHVNLRCQSVPWEVTEQNGRTRVAPPLEHLSTLTRLDFAHHVPAAELSKLRCLPALAHLRAVYVPNDAAPLTALTSLRCLQLVEGAPIDAAALRLVGALPSLERLDCGQALDLNAALPHLTHLATLTLLAPLSLNGDRMVVDRWLSFGPDGQPRPTANPRMLTAASVRHLACLTALRALSLPICSRLSDEQLRPVLALTSLTQLHIGGGDALSDAAFAFLRRMPRLEELQIVSCRRLTHGALAAVSSLTALSGLVFTDASPRVNADALAALVAGLPRLHALDCFAGNLTDAGLAVLAGLSALTSLGLSRCKQLTATGFAHLSHMSSLRHLDVGGLDFRPAIPHLTQLKQLQTLRFKSNFDWDAERFVTDDTLAAMSSLSALTELDLPRVRNVTLAGVAHVRALVSLRRLSLDLGKLPVSKALAHVSVLTNLTCLDFSGRREDLVDADLAHLLPLTALQSLSLENARQLSDHGLAGLTSLRALTELELTGCLGLTDWGPPSSGACFPSLRRLRLTRCARLTDCALMRLQHATALERLSLSGCELITDAAFERLTALRALTAVDLASCSLIGPRTLAALGRCPQLGHVQLGDCPRVTNEALRALASLPLRSLGLANNHNLSEEGVRTLSGLRCLELLCLTGCPRVDDRCLQLLSGRPGLHVSAGRTAVTEEGRALVDILPDLVSNSDSDSD